MKSNTRGLSLMLVILVVASSFAGTQEAPANKVYGEWLIRVKPDQGKVRAGQREGTASFP